MVLINKIMRKVINFIAAKFNQSSLTFSNIKSKFIKEFQGPVWCYFCTLFLHFSFNIIMQVQSNRQNRKSNFFVTKPTINNKNGIIVLHIFKQNPTIARNINTCMNSNNSA